MREVKVAMRYGGKPCGKTSETETCNDQACENDGELRDWTLGSTRSKDRDGGTKSVRSSSRRSLEEQARVYAIRLTIVSPTLMLRWAAAGEPSGGKAS